MSEPTFTTQPQQLASLTARVRHAINLRSVDDFVHLAKVLYEGGIQPPGVDRPAKLVPIILTGWELGFSVTQSVKWVMLNPNGNGCSIWGDAGLAILLRDGVLEDRNIEFTGTPGQDDRECSVRLKRINDPKSFERVYTFSLGQAKKLKSYKINGGPWASDSDNMLRWRALWRAMRAEFADKLLGISGIEEEEDVILAEVVSSVPQISSGGELVEMIDEQQLEEIVRLRGLAEASISDEDRLASVWATHLEPFGVKSARDLTTIAATKLIAVLTEEYDPFTSPTQSTA
jgi:hypothetical protein